jgi:hypothetical protein
MRTPEEIERMLGERLIPRGFSERGRQAIEGLIDELAGESPSPAGRGRWWGTGAAAAAVLAVAGWGWWSSPEVTPAAPAVVGELVSPLELLSESVGVVSAEPDLEFRSDAEGKLLEAWHVQVVSEERFRDTESGHVVTVRHPRDELVLMPVSNF